MYPKCGAMPEKETLYWRTHARLRAWTNRGSGLPHHYRRILGALEAPTTVEVLKQMSGCSAPELARWLEELHTLGFVETERAAAAYCSATA